ncbi:ATP-dependent nuclease [Nocardia colli]|uniref:ATP-dependent nuclease n=1 Tax=Nocardia colli TaxID=2545717 RepID=UPI0035DE0804
MVDWTEGQRVHISRVLIENFRNFRHLEIDPFPRSAVIVGENGTGKSNLIFALRLILDPNLPDSRRMLRPEDVSDYADRSLAEGAEVKVEIDIAGIESDDPVVGEFDGCFVETEPLVVRLTYVYRPQSATVDSDKQLTRDDFTFEIFGGVRQHDDKARTRRAFPLMVLPALRDAVDLLRGRTSPLHELLEARPPDQTLMEKVAQRIQESVDVLATDQAVIDIQTDLSKRLAEMTGPQIDLTPTLGFLPSPPEKLIRSIQLFLDANRTRGVAETSTGTANVIYLALLLEQLMKRQAKDTVFGNVLGVEEPEAHLHPVLQRNLFRYFLQSDPALIVTTHSPHIAAVSKLDNLVLLRRDSTGAVTARTTAGTGMTKPQRADIERYLDVSRAELLFCKAAILVEGPSEVYLLSALASVLDFDLDAHGVILANIAGTDFAPYRRLLSMSGLDVPHVIITDGDPWRKSEYVLAGLKRAARLLSDEKMAKAVAALAAGGPGASTAAETAKAAAGSVYVGSHTLEVDLTPLLADQMIAAHNDLEPSEAAQDRFKTAVRGLLVAPDDASHRKTLLGRITTLSKGRYAQRLAEHVEQTADALRRELATAIDACNSIGKSDPAKTLRRKPFLNTAELMALGRYGYLLAALDDISTRVRGHGLITRPEITPEPGE